MFLAKDTEFVGMFVGKDDVSVNPENVLLIRDWLKPETLIQLDGLENTSVSRSGVKRAMNHFKF